MDTAHYRQLSGRLQINCSMASRMTTSIVPPISRFRRTVPHVARSLFQVCAPRSHRLLMKARDGFSGRWRVRIIYVRVGIASFDVVGALWPLISKETIVWPDKSSDRLGFRWIAARCSLNNPGHFIRVAAAIKIQGALVRLYGRERPHDNLARHHCVDDARSAVDLVPTLIVLASQCRRWSAPQVRARSLWFI